MKYKPVICGRCLTGRIVYEDIHPKAWTCPTCCNVTGVTWREGFVEIEKSKHEVEPYLVGEDQYDWSWLDYENKNEREGAMNE